MNFSLLSLILALTPVAATANAQLKPCFQYEGQTLQDAAGEAIMSGILNESTSNLACLKELVAEGLDLSGKGNWRGDGSAVEEAAHSGSPEIMEYILSQGVSIGDMSDKIAAENLEETAAVGGSVEIVKMLQAHGMPVSHKNLAWPRGYMKPSNYFLDTCSPVMYEAVDYLRVEIVSYLLAQGENVNARCNQETYLMSNEGFPTPIMVLANSIEAYDSLNGDVRGRRVKANQLVKILIDAGADLNAREDIFGKSAASQLLASNWITPEMKAYVRAHVNK